MEEGLINKISINLELSGLFNRSVQNGYGCAIYRLPQSDEVHMIIDCEGAYNLESVNIENLESGYIFHPFTSNKHPIKYLKKDIHIVQKANLTPEIVFSKMSDDEFIDLFNISVSKNANEKHGAKSHKSIGANEDINKQPFIELVDKSIEEIHQEKFQKVVLSRTKKVTLDDQFSPFRLFQVLNLKYRNAYIHLTHIPDIGTWTGATPETLISIDKKNQFQTVALAATQAYNKQIGLEETTWSQKDIEEQAMVSRYIINCFKKIRLREFEEIGPRTYLSGNLVHLMTKYIVDMDQVEFPELGSVMLELLHPTSAVCGMPKQVTQEFIEENEGFDREYFSGFLGPVNIENETNIFVNLRCAKITGGQAQLFAGAGIISNSIPEREWNETEIKMDTILSAIRVL